MCLDNLEKGRARMKIAEVKLEFMQAHINDIPALIEKYKMDERSGLKYLLSVSVKT